MALQNLRSNTANKRPTASGMVDGQVAINTNATNPGLFFKDAGDGIRKVGPVFIGSSAPNSSPAAGGSSGHSIGEQWLDTSASRYVLKTWDGTAWRDDDSNYLQLTGGALSGALTIDNAANVAALDLKFDGDTNTGLYSPSADTLGFVTGGLERARISTHGRLGIGTTSPDRALEIQNASPIIRLTESAGTYSEISASTSILSFRADEGNGAANTRMDFRLNGSEKMRIDSSGNVGIGTSSPGFALEVNSSTSDSVALFQSTDATARIILRDNGSTSGGYVGVATEDMFFHTNGTERVRIDSSGNARFTQSIRTTASDGSTIIGEFGRSSLFITGGSQDDLGIRATGNMRFAAGGNTERMRISSSGSVGIGTSSPDSTLELAAGPPRLKLTRNTSASTGNDFGRIVFENSAGTELSRIDSTSTSGNTTPALRFSNNGSERMQIDSSGRLLVGTTSAVDTSDEAIVHVVDTLGARLVLGRNDTSVADGNGLGGIRFAGNDTTSNTFTTLGEILCQADGTHAAGDNPTRLTFKTTPDGSSTVTERMRIDSSGNVGIGTSSAAGKLHVFKGNGARNDYSTSADGLVIESSSDTGISIDPGAGNTANIYFPNTANHSIGQISHDLSTGELNLRAATYLRFSGSSNTERMRIDSSGNVGIGTTIPSSYGGAVKLAAVSAGNTALSIGSGTSSDGTLFFADGTSGDTTYRGSVKYSHASDAMQFSTAATERMRIDNSGDVGIGTSSPDEKLHVANTGGGASILIETNASSGGNLLFGDNSSNTVGRVQYQHSDNSMRLETNGSERLRITNVGNVGIGVSSPQSKFHVLGNSAETSLRVSSDRSGTTYGNACIVFDTPRASSSDGTKVDGRGMISCLGNSADNTGIFWVSAGSASLAPTESDTDLKANQSGLRLGSDGSLQHWASNNQRFGVTSTGSVGIGTSSPSQLVECSSGGNAVLRLDSGSTSTTGVMLARGGTEVARVSSDGTNILKFATGSSGSERMRIDSSGRVGIGHSTPQSLLTIGGDAITSVKPTVSIAPSSGSGSVLIRGGEPTLCFDQTGGNNQRIIYDNSTDLVFQNGTLDSITERVRFFDTGQTHHFSSNNVFVSASAQNAGTTYWLYRGIRSRTTNTSGGATVFYVYTNGNVQNTNNSYGSISDARLKENIVDATSQWDDLKALQIRKYNFIEGETHTQIGVIAQEVETVSPGLVNDIVDRDEEGNDLGTITKTVNYSVLYMKAVKALQEAMERIETLEAKVAALEAE